MSENPHELVGAYALGALDPAETAEFEAHLSGCDACREELASFDVVIDALLEDDEDDAPVPANLAARIAAGVAVTPQVTPPVAAQESSNVVPFLGRPLVRLFAAVAALLAVAGIGVALLSLGTPKDATLAELDRIREAPDATTVALGVGDAELVYSKTLGAFGATGTTPALEAGQTYQLWIVNADGTIDPGPTFPAGDFTAAAPDSLADAVAIAVSVEPQGGSLQPTTDPISAVTL